MAHWPAVETSVQALGGLSRCTAGLPQILMDLHMILDAYKTFKIDAVLPSVLPALLSEAIVLLAPTLSQVGLAGRPHNRQCLRFERAAVLRFSRQAFSSPAVVLRCLQSPELEEAALVAADELPRLAAVMARSGALQSLLAEARRLEQGGHAAAVRMGGRLPPAHGCDCAACVGTYSSSHTAHLDMTWLCSAAGSCAGCYCQQCTARAG